MSIDQLQGWSSIIVSMVGVINKMQAVIFPDLSILLLELGELLFNIAQLRSFQSPYSFFFLRSNPLFGGASPMLLRIVIEKRLSISNQDLYDFVKIHCSLLSITCVASIGRIHW